MFIKTGNTRTNYIGFKYYTVLSLTPLRAFNNLLDQTGEPIRVVSG